MTTVLREITPFIAVWAPIAAVVALFDYILKDNPKAMVFNGILSMSHLSARPLSLPFYLLILFSSSIFTLVIISINGAIESIANENAPLIAFKSSGPLIIAVCLKVVFWDYAMALKSHFLSRLNFRGREEGYSQGNIGRSIQLFGNFIVLSIDLCFTAVLTSLFLSFWENYQSASFHEGTELANVAEPLMGFFDELNFLVKESMTKAFYVLNGSLVLYLSAGLSYAVRGTAKYLNVESMQNNVFKIISGISTFVVLIIGVCRSLAN